MRAMREQFMKEGRGKRICSILTALAMTLSLFAGVGAASFAEEAVPEGGTEVVSEEVSEEGSEAAPKTITEVATEANGEPVSKTDVETTTGEEQAPALGDGESKTPIETVNVEITIPKVNSDATVAYTYPTEGNYTVEPKGQKWWIGNNESLSVEKIINGNEYGMTFTVKTAEGHAFTDRDGDGQFTDKDVKVLVNNAEEGVSVLGGSEESIEFGFICKPQPEGYITKIDLLNVPKAGIGQQAIQYNCDTETYTATGTWYVYNNQTGKYQPVDVSHIFTEGKIYKLDLKIVPKPGHVFSEGGCTLHINGEERNFSYDEDGDIEIDPFYFSSSLKEITVIHVDESAIPKVKAGASFTDTMINVKAPAGSNYTLAGYWTDEDGNKAGTFTKGKAYYFHLMIYANDGYYLAKDLEIFIGDKWEMITSEAAFAEYPIRQSLAQVIDQVTLKNLPKAKIGAAIPEGEFKISVPSGAKYTATAAWLDETSVFASGTFQNGKAYTLEINIVPKAGYEFAETLIIVADGVKHKYTHNTPEGAHFSKTTSFRQEIKKVELTGLTEPKAGATPDKNISIPSGAPYTVEDITWMAVGRNSGGEVSGTFESGKAYETHIRIKPKEGYEFTESTVVTLNGKEVRTYGEYEDWFIVLAEWSLEEVITNIKVNNVPTMKIGQKARADVSIPKDAKYYGHGFWSVWNDEQSRWEPFSGTFKKGKSYRFGFAAFPEEGYRFSKESTKFYVDGKKRSGEIQGPYNAIYTASYSTGMKVIDKVEFHVSEPKTGNHASVGPVITTADGARYSADVDRAYWLRRPGKSNEVTYQIDREYFREGIDYGVQFEFLADAGYVFSDDLTVIVNGRILEAGDYIYNDKNGNIKVFFSDLAYKKAAVDKTNGGGVDTGDDADMLPWVILASTSLMAAAGVMSRRKVS